MRTLARHFDRSVRHHGIGLRTRYRATDVCNRLSRDGGDGCGLQVTDGSATASLRATADNQTVTVGAGQTAMVSIVDSYVDSPGAIQVTKTIAGSGAGLQGPIAILVSCQEPNFVFVFRVPAGAAAGTYHEAFTGIPAGLTCTVTEVQDGSNASITAVVVGRLQTVVLQPNSLATVGITDTYQAPPTPSVPTPQPIPGLPNTGGYNGGGGWMAALVVPFIAGFGGLLFFLDRRRRTRKRTG